MSDEQPPREADLDEVNTRLQHGLQTCRSVLANYRTLLTGAEASSNDNEPVEGDGLSELDEG